MSNSVKMYVVEISASTEVVVLAETSEQAEEIAVKNGFREMSPFDLADISFAERSEEIKSAGQIPEDWGWAVPYGEENLPLEAQNLDLTTREYLEYLKALKEPVEKYFVDPRQLDLLP